MITHQSKINAMDTFICSNPVYNINDDFWVGKNHIFISIYHKNGIGRGNTELVAVNKNSWDFGKADWVFNLKNQRVQSNYTEDESRLFFMSSQLLIVIDKKTGILAHSVNIFQKLQWEVPPNQSITSYKEHNLVIIKGVLYLNIRYKSQGSIQCCMVKMNTNDYSVLDIIPIPSFPHCFRTIEELIAIKCSNTIVFYNTSQSSFWGEIQLPEKSDNNDDISYSDCIEIYKNYCIYRFIKGKDEYVRVHNLLDKSFADLKIGDYPYFDSLSGPPRMWFKRYEGAIYFISTEGMLLSVEISTCSVNWIAEKQELEGIESWEVEEFSSSNVILRSFDDESIILFVDIELGKVKGAFIEEKRVFQIIKDDRNYFMIQGDDYEQKKLIKVHEGDLSLIADSNFRNVIEESFEYRLSRPQ